MALSFGLSTFTIKLCVNSQALNQGTHYFKVTTLYIWVWFQEEVDDDDEWNPCKAAGVCLMLMATGCEDDIVPHILPFVKDNIHHQDWRFRDAAVMAFGGLWCYMCRK